MISTNIKPIHYYLLSITFFCTGALYYVFAHNVLIINSPFNSETMQPHQAPITKRKANLYYWHHDKWQNEEIDLLWSTDMAQTLQHLISSWLSLVAEEKLSEKQVNLQSVALSNQQQEAFISFDRNPFDKHLAAYEKLLWIEGLLKTIKENDIKIQAIQFLAHHKPLNDYHLEFINPWPLEGFIDN